MNRSHAVEVSGQCAGAALGGGGMACFVALGPRLGMLDRRLRPGRPAGCAGGHRAVTAPDGVAPPSRPGVLAMAPFATLPWA